MTTEVEVGLDAIFDHAAMAAGRIRDLLPVYRDILGGRFHLGGDNARVGYTLVQIAQPGPGHGPVTDFGLDDVLAGNGSNGTGVPSP